MDTYKLINLCVTGNWSQLAKINESELDETQQFFRVAALSNCPIKEIMEQWNLFLTQINLEPRMLITLHNAYQLAEVTLPATKTDLGIKIKKTIGDFIKSKKFFFIKAIVNKNLFNEIEIETIQNTFKDQLSYTGWLSNNFLEIKNDLFDIYNKISKNTEKTRRIFFDDNGTIISQREQEILTAWYVQAKEGISEVEINLKNITNKLEKDKSFDNNETDILINETLQLNKF